MSFHIGVYGSAAGNLPDETVKKARIIGERIAQYDGVLVTGACPGLPHAAALAAAENGGMVLGFSPAANLADHTGKEKFPADPFYHLIFTGLGKKGRNVISVHSCQAAIFISGCMGTLNEFTIAFDEMPSGGVIGVLTNTGGAADEIESLVKKFGKQSWVTIICDPDPAKLVERIFKQLTLNG